MEIHKILRKARNRAGISQMEMGSILGYSRTYITKMESGTRRLAWEDVVQWMKHTNANDLLIAATLAIDPVAAANLLQEVSRVIGLIVMC